MDGLPKSYKPIADQETFPWRNWDEDFTNASLQKRALKSFLGTVQKQLPALGP